MQTLVQNSEVYLLDEPESFLDLHFRHVLARTLKEFVNRFKKVVLFVSHDLSIVFKAASSMINFSSETLLLEDVTQETIAKHQAILEKKSV